MYLAITDMLKLFIIELIVKNVEGSETMSKIVIKPTNKKQIKLHDSIIVGVKNLSIIVL